MSVQLHSYPQTFFSWKKEKETKSDAEVQKKKRKEKKTELANVAKSKVH